MPVVWAGLVVIGLAVALMASRVAVDRAAMLVAGSRIPPFLVGITLLAIGTDLPEIANSIVASFAGEGDLNVGDSVGSAATQVTLVLGLMPLIAGAFVVGRERVLRIGVVTVAALLLGALLVADGDLDRLDASILIGGWIAGSAFVYLGRLHAAEPVMRVEFAHRVRRAGEALLALAVVASGASLAVWGFIELAEELDVPKYLLAFFAASIGTSLPELVVDLTALRRGERDMAVGGLMGSSFVDSSLSIAAGPMLAPTAVTASLAVRGSIAAAVAVALVVAVLATRREHTVWTGLALLGIYALFYVVLLA